MTKLPYWVRGDTNAFFGFGVNVLVNVLTLTGLCIGVIKMPASDVFGVILPALGYRVPLGPTLVGFTFFASLVPIIGNLLSNAAITIAALTVSVWLGIASLGFLVCSMFGHLALAKMVWLLAGYATALRRVAVASAATRLRAAPGVPR